MIIAMIAACSAFLSSLGMQLNGAVDAAMETIADIMFI
ncbi:hypothetical protein JCM19240_2563 [Vibrio maritimus]|uniref:Uncharacterized protein n=1 Tax=Vibrio maritimus TaxID=990268 RepID=A0A090TCP7_9VIBR|nr:hypothetical protein JCM19240_2563 [Vibrio maritimus]